MEANEKEIMNNDKIREIMELSLVRGEERPSPNLSLERIAYKWFSMTKEERIQSGFPTAQKDMASFLTVGTTKMRDLKRAYMNKNFDTPPIAEIISGDYDSKKYLLSRSKEVDDGLIEAAKKGNAQAARVIKQLTGELEEKPIEVRIGLSADEIARRNAEADRELAEWNKRRSSGQRVEEVQAESSLLP